MADSSGEKRPKARQAGSSGQRRVRGLSKHLQEMNARLALHLLSHAPAEHPAKRFRGSQAAQPVPRASRAPESPPHRPLRSRPLSQAPAEHPKESASRELDLVRSPRRMKCCLEPQQS